MPKGIKAFLLDTVDSMEIRRLQAQHPAIGKYVWIELLSNIYRDEGYYMYWNDAIADIFASEIHVKKDKVEKILVSCLTLGLFDKEQFDRNGVLTSSAIVHRYCAAKVRNKKIELQKCFLCSNFDETAYKNVEIVYRNPKNVGNSSTNLIEVNISEVNKKINQLIPTLDEVRAFCKSRNLSINPDYFYSYYSEKNWKTGSGKPVDDWQGMCITWNSNQWLKQDSGDPVNIPDYMIRQMHGKQRTDESPPTEEQMNKIAILLERKN